MASDSQKIQELKRKFQYSVSNLRKDVNVMIDSLERSFINEIGKLEREERSQVNVYHEDFTGTQEGALLQHQISDENGQQHNLGQAPFAGNEQQIYDVEAVFISNIRSVFQVNAQYTVGGLIATFEKVFQLSGFNYEKTFCDIMTTKLTNDKKKKVFCDLVTEIGKIQSSEVHNSRSCRAIMQIFIDAGCKITKGAN